MAGPLRLWTRTVRGSKKILFKRMNLKCSRRLCGVGRPGRRVNERSLEITYKFKGKITGTWQIELSTDLKTLTMTERPLGQNRPKSILVFDRE